MRSIELEQLPAKILWKSSGFVLLLAGRCLFAIVLVSVAPFSGFPQTLDANSKLRLAQGLEQSGEHERAAVLYQELLKAEPSNYVFFDGVYRTSMQLKRYEEAIALIRNRLVAYPGDIHLLGLLGTAQYRAGNEAEAYAAWERAIALHTNSPAAYRSIATVMIENRLLDRAAEVYRRSRVACKQPDLFAIELAQLSVATMDYLTASEEYLRWFSQNPSQIAFVQGRMATFTGKVDGRAAAIQTVRQAIQQEENVRLYELLEWLYIEGREFEEAFAVARKADVLLGARGGAIMAFADRAFTGRAFDVAARAYREAVSTPLPREKLPIARYGFARSLHESGVTADSVRGEAPARPPSEAIPQYMDAIVEYERIIADYPLSEFSTRSRFQIGVLQFEKYFDLDAALASFDAAVRESGGNAALRCEATLRAGAVLLARGDTLGARDRFLTVGAATDALPDQSDEASFRLAEIDFFGGNHEAARNRLDLLVVNLKADYANDAIQLQAFLQENGMTVPVALVEYGKAEFLARQHRSSEAVQQFTAIVQRYPGALLVDDALLRIAVLEETAGRYAEAAAAYERLLNEFKERSSVQDRALFRLGRVYELRAETRSRAIGVYEQLLAGYPSSLFATEARMRIRRLRGETL